MEYITLLVISNVCTLKTMLNRPKLIYIVLSNLQANY